MLTLVEYVLLVPDSIARLPGSPAGLLVSYSGTGPRIEPTHTALNHWQVYSLCLATPLSVPERLGAGAGGLLVDSAVAGQLHPFAAAMISCLLTSSTSTSSQRSARC
jgi:hypothetical protein